MRLHSLGGSAENAGAVFPPNRRSRATRKSGRTVTDGICKNKIIFVPGKTPKPAPEDHRALLWRCLRRGLELVDPATARAIAAVPDCFQLVAWNAVFYGHVKDVEEDVPWIEVLCHKTGPDAADVREALSWRNKRARVLYTLGDHFPALIPLLPAPAVQSK